MGLVYAHLGECGVWVWLVGAIRRKGNRRGFVENAISGSVA